ncbi:hypothetical protein [Mesorhizobium sp. WSM2239]|uniref:DUF2793 domain-containing protein n=2 Tax=unclassified Mesorhizobium TaxID=325217 RepID=A0AAU8DFX9_9HYPH
MAKLNIVRTSAPQQSHGVGAVPVARDKFLSAETLTTSAASQVNAEAIVSPDEFWMITASGGNVWLAFDVAPVAAVDTGLLLLDGSSVTLAGTPGHKLAVIDG